MDEAKAAPIRDRRCPYICEEFRKWFAIGDRDQVVCGSSRQISANNDVILPTGRSSHRRTLHCRATIAPQRTDCGGPEHVREHQEIQRKTRLGRRTRAACAREFRGYFAGSVADFRVAAA
jgi:hypothetical protein